jgi:hypothetical protein
MGSTACPLAIATSTARPLSAIGTASRNARLIWIVFSKQSHDAGQFDLALQAGNARTQALLMRNKI